VAFSVDELKQKTIGVLYGGLSAEREVSLKSGDAVARALEGRGFKVARIDVGKDVPEKLREAKVEVAFVTVHGRYGEDGCLQGLLESLFIPYTGSGVLSSALAMEKVYAKQVFVSRGIPTAEYRAFEDAKAADIHGYDLPFHFPVVVKPSGEGSSVGVKIAKNGEELRKAAQDAAAFKGSILVERYVKGREIQVGVLGDEALGCIEVKPAGEFYDYNAKYVANTTQYLFPAPLPEAQYHRCMEVALLAHKALGCTGATRTDLILPETGGDPIVLEVNTLPGMTEKSLLPKIAAGKGWDFGELCERILRTASLKA
jgi:D-alanine-D-alanine ligase